MTMLMKTGILEKISGENKLLDGLGMASASKSQMSKFKKILNNLTKNEKSVSSQFIRQLLNKPHKMDLDRNAVSSGLINFLHNKVESGEEIDIETDLLEGLMQQFVRHSLETGGSVAFEVESESHGTIKVKFDPKDKKLSIESEISRELVANSGFMNIFSDLDIENIEFVDSKKISILEDSSINSNGKSVKPGSSNLLAFKGIVNGFSEIADGVKSNSFSFVKKTSKNKASQKSSIVENAGLSGQSEKTGKSDLLAKINLSKKSILSDKTDGAAKTSVKQGKKSDAIISLMKPANTKKTQISPSQAVEAIKNTVTQSGSVFSGKAAGKFQVSMDVAEKGVLTVSSQKNENAIETNIQVETLSAKDWLKSALAKKGITVDNISVRAKSDSPKIKNEVIEKMASIDLIEQRLKKTIPGGEKLSVSNDNKISVEGKEAISAKPEKLNAKISQAIMNGGKVEHTVKAGSEQTIELLEKELRPIADEIVKEELPASKLSVAKETSVKSSLKSEVVAINPELPDVKPIGKDAKQKAALSSVNLLNADEASGDEDDLSGESQFSKNDFQIKESLSFKEVQGAEFKLPVESRGDGSQVVNISTAAGQVQFNAVNGKLISAQKLDTSHMPEMIQKIAELAHNQANLSSHKLEVQMDIKDMGKIMVDSLHHADKIHLQIQVESSEIRRVLETQLKPFIEQMAKDGIDIGKLDVSVRDEKQGNQTPQNFSESGFQNREDKQASGNLNNFFSGFESGTEIRQDFERKQVRPKVTGSQTLEIWA